MITAITTLEQAKNQGALIYVNEGNFNAPPKLYKVEVTIITLRVPKHEGDESDFYTITGKLMPKREVVDRIGEISGLSFIAQSSRNYSELRDDAMGGKRTVFITEQQGRIRMIDGSWRESSIQTYEFDPTLRAMEEVGITEWTTQTRQAKKNGSGKSAAQRALEYMKFGRQRAETGARLRVIREMTGMPTAFTLAEASKHMAFARVIQNTDYLLQTAEGRLLAAAQATGNQDVIAGLFGRKALGSMPEGDPTGEPELKNVTPEQPKEPEPSGSPAAPRPTVSDTPAENLAVQASMDAPATAAAPAQAAVERPAGNTAGYSGNDEFQNLTLALEEYLEAHWDILNVQMAHGINPCNLLKDELENFNATVDSRRSMLDRIKKFLNSKGVAA